MRDGHHINGPLSACTRESIVFDMIGRDVPADLSAAAPAEETVILEVSGVF